MSPLSTFSQCILFMDIRAHYSLRQMYLKTMLNTTNDEEKTEWQQQFFQFSS